MDDLYTLLEQAVSNEDYRYILERIRWQDGFACPRCGGQKAYRIKNRCLFQCTNCRAQVSATSGTALHGARNLRSWVKAILSFLKEEGLSAVSVSQILNRSYATTWFMMHKIRLVLKNSNLQVISEQLTSELETIPISIPCPLLAKALFKPSKNDQFAAISQDIEINSNTKARAKVLEDFLLGVFRGVSRKYAQLYACELHLRLLADNLEPLSLLTLFTYMRIKTYRKNLTNYCSPLSIQFYG